ARPSRAASARAQGAAREANRCRKCLETCRCAISIGQAIRLESISTLDANAIQKVVDQLEYRGTDLAFVRMRATYFDRLALTPTARIPDCGCGTGVVSRALARRDGFVGMVVAIDVSAASGTRWSSVWLADGNDKVFQNDGRR